MESVNGHREESAPGDRPVHALLDQAREAFARGDLEGAEDLCEQGLAAESDFPPLLELSGVVACQRGRLDIGVERFRWLVQLTAENPSAWFNLGNALLGMGTWDEAREALRRADELAPDNTEILVALGTALRNTGDPAAALQAVERVVAARPDHLAGLNALAATLAELGRVDEASAALQRALAIDPRSATLRLNAGQLLLDMGQYGNAAEQFEMALTAEPRNVDARVGMGMALSGKGDFDGAAHHLKRGLRYAPGHAPALYVLIDVHEHEGRLDEAEALIDQVGDAVRLDPNYAFLKARLRVRRGDLAGAAAALEAIALESLPDAMRSRVGAELGIVLDQLGRSDDAWAAFTVGNEASAERWERVAPGPNRFVERTQAVAAAIESGDLARGAVAASTDDAPVFVLGFPRSGTTLLGRILDAHPAFATADEIPALLQEAIELESSLEGGYPAGLIGLDEAGAAVSRRRYRDRFPDSGVRRLVDKMPLNLIHGGLIRALFGTAPIVQLIRDPRDACLSCFMQPFDLNSAMANFLTLEDTVALYAAVTAAWEQQVEALDLNVHRLRYEDLVAAPEETLTALCEFLGVPFEPAMLAFDRSGPALTPIRTPSYRQVGEGLN
ncbi:MAG: sulfotransferase, partial [Pseudomonadota bacterium]